MNPDFGTTNIDLIKDGHTQLSGEDIRGFISDKTISGDYGSAFKFVTYFDANGTMEGKNNVGSHNRGEWSINDRDGTLSVSWDAGWDTTTTHAFDVGGKIKLFIHNTGQWNTTLHNVTDGRRNLEP